MKKVFIPLSLLCAASLFALLPSCSKKDDGPATRAQMITGTWNTTEVGVDSNNNGSWDTQEHLPASGSSASVKVTFNGDGTGTATYSAFPTAIPITWSLQNDESDIRMISNFAGFSDTTMEHIVSLSSTDAVVRDESLMPVAYLALKKQ